MAEAKRPMTPADILDGYALPGIQRLDLSPGCRPVMTARCGARWHPWGRTPREVGRYLQITEEIRGQGLPSCSSPPTMAGDESFKRWFAKLETLGAGARRAMRARKPELTRAGLVRVAKVTATWAAASNTTTALRAELQFGRGTDGKPTHAIAAPNGGSACGYQPGLALSAPGNGGRTSGRSVYLCTGARGGDCPLLPPTEHPSDHSGLGGHIHSVSAETHWHDFTSRFRGNALI